MKKIFSLILIMFSAKAGFGEWFYSSADKFALFTAQNKLATLAVIGAGIAATSSAVTRYLLKKGDDKKLKELEKALEEVSVLRSELGQAAQQFTQLPSVLEKQIEEKINAAKKKARESVIARDPQNLDDRLALLRQERERLILKQARFTDTLKEQVEEMVDAGFQRIVAEEIDSQQLYQYFGINNLIGKHLPCSAVKALVDMKVEELLPMIGQERANLIRRQIRPFFENEITKEHYDAYILGEFSQLKISEREFTSIQERLEQIEAEQMQILDQKAKDENFVYDGLDKDLKSFIKGNEFLKVLFEKNAKRFYQYSLEKRKKMIFSIFDGALLFYALTHNDALSNDIKVHMPLSVTEGRVDQIRDIINYFFALAIYKDQPFHEGTFMLHYPKARNVFEFFHELKDASTPVGYQRRCSHLRGFNLEDQTFGVDVPRLPENKSTVLHILVNSDDRGYDSVFVKPENYGTKTFWDLFAHAGELFYTQAKKPHVQAIVPVLRRLVGTDQEEGFRKERIPQRVVDLYEKALAILGKNEDEGKFLIGEAKKFGISFIAQQLEQLVSILRETHNPYYTQIETILKEATEGYDKVKLRIGQEVVLADELNQFTPEILQEILKFNIHREQESWERVDD